MATKANKRNKAPLSSRFGGLVARTIPGTAVRLGRLTKRAGKGTAKAATNFRDGFMKGWDDV